MVATALVCVSKGCNLGKFRLPTPKGGTAFSLCRHAVLTITVLTVSVTSV